MAFDAEDFVARCRAALGGADAPQRIADIVREAIADPQALAETVRARQAARGKPAMAEVFINDDTLTAYQLAWPAGLIGPPHDHAGWAVVGVYAGAEAFNVYEQRPDGTLARVGREVIAAPKVAVLPKDLIHDIEAAGETPSGSIHVYPNRHFVCPERRLWRDAESAPESFTMAKSMEYGTAVAGPHASGSPASTAAR
jgi:predicted metal-dependent enzyme (double-stranded beta helix superfamily)